MKIKISTVKKIRVTHIKNLDPIDIIMEDIKEHIGKITITCFGEAWTYIWGGIGNSKISEFILSCDNDYLAGKLAPQTPSAIQDIDNLSRTLITAIAKKRRIGELSKKQAADLHFKAKMMYNEISGNEELLSKVFGSEWWHSLPEKLNPEYEYFCRIINTVKKAIKEFK